MRLILLAGSVLALDHLLQAALQSFPDTRQYGRGRRALAPWTLQSLPTGGTSVQWDRGFQHADTSLERMHRMDLPYSMVTDAPMVSEGIPRPGGIS
jgi:hypothetical protein